jgi:hypothetical protein
VPHPIGGVLPIGWETKMSKPTVNSPTENALKLVAQMALYQGTAFSRAVRCRNFQGL